MKTTNKKITMATVKSFVKKNINELHVKCCSRFDGMTDCVEKNTDAAYKKVDPEKLDFNKPSFGFDGFWTVGCSRDYIKQITENNFTGFEVSNSCGRSIIAIKN